MIIYSLRCCVSWILLFFKIYCFIIITYVLCTWKLELDLYVQLLFKENLKFIVNYFILEKSENFMPWKMQISKEIIFKWGKVLSTLQFVYYAQNKLASLRLGENQT